MKTKRKSKIIRRTHYYVVACSHEFNYEDKTLEEAVGRRSDGSGAGFGERDLDWQFDHLQQALKAFKALSRFQNLTTLTVSYQREY